MPSTEPLNRNAPAPAVQGWTSQRTAWLIFCPPAFMVAVRWLLQLVDDRQNTVPALPLAPVSTTAGALDLLWPVALALALLVGAGLVIYRLGWRRVMPVIGAAWLLLWLLGTGALLQRHLNRQGLLLQGMTAAAAAPQASTRARVVSAYLKPASLRSLGGTEMVLQIDGLDIPNRLLLDDAGAASLKPGDTLALQLAPGRFNGLFVTGWQAAPSVSP
ncbi:MULTISPECIES: hypothetical protein [unclassified Polaromonas]|uniref:hypothetical protein n=1 Tax=unclassified Polaromonas TaxID=2638319 RepID=UPI0018CBE956|nr:MULTISPECIES: hypothetical protein [unclassified Polaromonas]MBG6072962.1 hypothetical protein [Polaromonas sp. CG_9.7]MBG6114888.1 hypothetical protein [Polaromonas sp. CG_9.2]MDH6183610.1 hypothetical protein [Polaromonas sp. CG_23.6]